MLWVLFFGYASPLLYAQTTWNGSTSTDWNTPANWSAGVPDATDVVTIPNVVTTPVILGGTAAVAKSVLLQTAASLTVNAMGSLTINGAPTIGLLSQGTVTNNGTITIGNLASVGIVGIKNDGPSAAFLNNAEGAINLNNSSSDGIQNSSGGHFTNAGKITIGVLAGVGINGIQNSAGSNFSNMTCAALIQIVSNNVILNNGVFSNAGGIIENASGNSSISTNTGVVQNLNGGTFTIGSGNAAIEAASDIWTGCTSTDWVEATNWLDGSVPTATDDAVIPDLTNDPIIVAGTTALAQSVEVFIGASLTVDATGSLTINGSAANGIHNKGTVTNTGNITIGSLTTISLHGIMNEGSSSVFENNVGGEISIDRSQVVGLRCQGSFANSGKITIGALAGVGSGGLLNDGVSAVFQNHADGEIRIDRTTGTGLGNSQGTFTNAGKIIVGALAASAIPFGLSNSSASAVFRNNAGGEINIDRTTIFGLHNNLGSFFNAAKITIGAVASVGQDGIRNEGVLALFENNAGGEIKIDRTSGGGLQNSNGSFINAAKITIGAVASVGSEGIRNEAAATFNNSTCAALIRIVSNSIILNTATFTNAGGIIENASGNSSISSNTGTVLNLNGGNFNIGSGNAAISFTTDIWTGCTSTDWAEPTNWFDGSVPTATDDVNIPNQANDPIIVAGTAAAAKSVKVETAGSLVVNAAGSLDISGSGGVGILNLGTVENYGTLRIDATGNDGILNDAIFTNKGTLAIGAVASIGGFGIENIGSFTNESGSLSIDRTNFQGISNPVGTFTNKATLQIGGVASLNGGGIIISPTGLFLNESGSLSIDRTGIEGVANLGTFTNKAALTIGAVAGSIGTDGIRNTGTFLNDVCAQITLFDNLNNNATFTNAGLFRVKTAQAHANSALTNNGIIEYAEGNPIPNVTNNDFIVAAKTIDCSGGTNMLQKGGALSFTAAATWFTNQNLTTPAGTYNQAANTFVPSGLPAGPQTLFFSISDNANGCPRTVSISVNNNADVTPPTINCPANPAVTPANPATCSAVVNGINASASDNCATVSIAFALTGTTVANGIGQASGQTFNTGETTVTYTATDGNNLTASCHFTVTVSPCFNGRIIWKQDNVSGVKDVTVALTGDQTATAITPLNGTYSFAVTNGSNFTITPSKNLNKLNGVNASDVFRLQQHLSGSLITDPYLLVAADVNSNNIISALDVNIIQLSILGNPSALAQMVKSWRFVPTTHVMGNPPFGFPESITINSSNAGSKDFFGIKVGDVVPISANPANLVAAPAFVLTTFDQALYAGHTLEVDFRASQTEDLAAFQLALQFDPERLQLLDIEPSTALPMSKDNFGTYQAEEGHIKVLWAGTRGTNLEEAAPLFRLHFKVLESGGRLSEALSMDENTLPGRAYKDNLVESAVLLHYFGGTSATAPSLEQALLQLLQNQPNPFVASTQIGFELPDACVAQLRILDAHGRVVSLLRKQYTAGKHLEVFELENVSGVLYYELTTPFGILVKKMLAVAE